MRLERQDAGHGRGRASCTHRKLVVMCCVCVFDISLNKKLSSHTPALL